MQNGSRRNGIDEGNLVWNSIQDIGKNCHLWVNISIAPESKDEESQVPNVFREDAMMWHQIMRHIGEKCLQSLQGKGMVEGMSNFYSYFDFCEYCLYGKNNQVKFPSGVTMENEILELIHNDMFGPVLVPSLGGYLYYVRFIYDFHRNTLLYFLKNKSEVFSKFKEFKSLVENEIEKKIKVQN